MYLARLLIPAKSSSGFDLDALGRVFACDARAEVFRRIFHVFAGCQIDNALLDTLGKGFADVVFLSIKPATLKI